MTDWPDNLAEYEATFDDLEPTVEEKLAALDRLAEPPRGLWSPAEWIFAAFLAALLAASAAVAVLL